MAIYKCWIGRWRELRLLQAAELWVSASLCNGLWWHQHWAVKDTFCVQAGKQGRVWLGFDWLFGFTCFVFDIFWWNKVISPCPKDVHVIYCFGLYKGNYFGRELGFVSHMPERKPQPQCSQQSFRSQQEEWSLQHGSPQLYFILNLSLISFYRPFGRISLWRELLNFSSVTECYDSK